jgi:hypothetical protein
MVKFGTIALVERPIVVASTWPNSVRVPCDETADVLPVNDLT